jgi:hypothetical protein
MNFNLTDSEIVVSIAKLQALQKAAQKLPRYEGTILFLVQSMLCLANTIQDNINNEGDNTELVKILYSIIDETFTGLNDQFGLVISGSPESLPENGTTIGQIQVSKEAPKYEAKVFVPPQNNRRDLREVADLKDDKAIEYSDSNVIKYDFKKKRSISPTPTPPKSAA